MADVLIRGFEFLALAAMLGVSIAVGIAFLIGTLVFIGAAADKFEELLDDAANWFSTGGDK